MRITVHSHSTLGYWLLSGESPARFTHYTEVCNSAYLLLPENLHTAPSRARHISGAFAT